MQNFKNIYYLGPDGSYCSFAMKDFLKIASGENLVAKPSIRAVLRAVNEDKNSAAVLPVENSIEGTVREMIDNFAGLEDETVKITGETVLNIAHCCGARTRDKSSVKRIYSHIQALRQCEGYIAENFPDAKIFETSSTSEAAKCVNDEFSACIASEFAVNANGLFILDKNVNDEKPNQTRFVLLSREKIPPSGNDKTSILFSVKNKPGALSDVLKVFAARGINLMLIESRPSRKKRGEYRFFIDAAGHASEMLEAFEEIFEFTGEFKVLGSYPMGAE